MVIYQLDLKTRCKLYTYTKKFLRKYKKDIATGKLSAVNFVDKLLVNEDVSNLIDNNILNDVDFKDSYVNYIDILIKNPNENLMKTNQKNFNLINLKPTITQKIQFKNLLLETGYELIIPAEYLTFNDVKGISKFISTGVIDIGNEKIYNYVVKLNKH